MKKKLISEERVLLERELNKTISSLQVQSQNNQKNPLLQTGCSLYNPFAPEYLCLLKLENTAPNTLSLIRARLPFTNTGKSTFNQSNVPHVLKDSPIIDIVIPKPVMKR